MTKKRLKVFLDDRRRYNVEIEFTDTVSVLKHMIQNLSKIPVACQELYHGSSELNDWSVINSYRVKDGDEIHLVVKQSAGRIVRQVRCKNYGQMGHEGKACLEGPHSTLMKGNQRKNPDLDGEIETQPPPRQLPEWYENQLKKTLKKYNSGKTEEKKTPDSK